MLKIMKWFPTNVVDVRVNGNVAKALADTGSSQTLIKSNLKPDTFCLLWRQRTWNAATIVSCPKTIFLVNSVYTKNFLNAHVHV